MIIQWYGNLKIITDTYSCNYIFVKATDLLFWNLCRTELSAKIFSRIFSKACVGRLKSWSNTIVYFTLNLKFIRYISIWINLNRFTFPKIKFALNCTNNISNMKKFCEFSPNFFKHHIHVHFFEMKLSRKQNLISIIQQSKMHWRIKSNCHLED